MKVTTKKQVFYPSYQDETEEVLEMQDQSALPIKTVYSKPMYNETKYVYSPPQKRNYEEKHHPHEYDHYEDHSGSKERSRRKENEKRRSRHSKPSSVVKEPIFVEAVPTYPTQNFVPMYSHVPMYGPNIYGTSMYYPISNTYSYIPYAEYSKTNGKSS